jgi:hypothetical protein
MKTILLIALSLFLLDILFFDMFVLVPLVIYIIICLTASLFTSLKALLIKKEMPITRERWAKQGIFVLLAICILLANHYKIIYAEQRGDVIIKCCENYKQEHGDYPAKISDLVPECLDKIPSPDLIGISGKRFRYRKRDDIFTLEYTLYFAMSFADNYDSSRGSWLRVEY